MSLPEKLHKEPIIDALFEIRFNSDLATSELLPGFLYNALEGNKSIELLQTAQIPRNIREATPNLRYAPIKRLNYENFFINISDRSISIGCKLPYPGWSIFKKFIEQVLKIVSDKQIIKTVERYSVKYVDLIQSTTLSEQVKLLNLDLTVADHKLEQEAFQIRIEIQRNNFINVINLLSSASLMLSNAEVKQGVVIDIDSISELGNITIQNFLENFSEKLDSIHDTNKTIFFSCLKQDAINSLEPSYAP